MTRLHLHIGGPKTGTTSFQAALARDGALDGTGFWSPEAGRVRKGGHHHLARNLIGIFDQPRKRFDPIATLSAERDAHEGDAIISAEYCDRLLTGYPVMFAKLLDELSKVFADIHVIRVWRDPATLMSSRYQQSICNFIHNQSFEDFARTVLRDEETQLRAALEGFGDGRTGVHIGYRDGDEGFDSVDAVCRAIGVRFALGEGDAVDRVKNPSRSLAQVAASKWLMDECGFAPGAMRTLQRRELHNAIRDAIEDRGGDPARLQGMTPSLLAESRDRNQTLRDQFAARFWDRSWDETTGVVSAIETVDLSAQHLPEDTAKLARDVVDDIKSRMPKLLSSPILRRDHAITPDFAHARLVRMSEPGAPTRRRKARRRLVLHVGGHKTGTTSFQAHLTPPSDLLERSGMWTPHFGQGHDGAHHHLIYQLVGASSAMGDVDALKALATVSAVDERPCLISSEFCHHLTVFQPALFRKLIRRLGEIFDEIKIVHVVRETRALINSHYQQDLCTFMTKDDFPAYARAYIEQQRRVLARTLNGFGMGLEIVSLPYQPHREGFDSVGELAAAMGLAAPTPLPRENERRSLAQMEACRRLVETGAVDFDALIHAQRSRIYRAVGVALTNAPAGPRFQGFDAALSAEVDRANAALRDRFAKQSWGAGWAEIFGVVDLGPHQSLAPDALPPAVKEAAEDAVATVTPMIPKYMHRGAVAPLGPWNMTVRRQFAQLAKLNQAARAEEKAGVGG